MSKQKRRLQKAKSKKKDTSHKTSKSKAPTIPKSVLRFSSSLVLSIITFLSVITFTPHIPNYIASNGSLFIVAFLSAAVVFLTMHYRRIKWIKYAIRVLIPTSLFFNFIASAGLKFHWFDTPFWGKLAVYSVIPGAAFCWVAFASMTRKTARPSASNDTAFQKKPSKLLYYILSGIVLLLSGILIFFKLGYYDLGVDEPLMYKAALGFNEQGWSYFQDGYSRTWANSVLIGLTMRIFGTAEWSARLPAAIAGIIFLFTCFYVFGKGWKNKWLAILIPILCLLNDRFLYQFRIVRMYAFLIPLFLFGIYLLYKILESKKSYNLGSFKKLSGFHNEWVQFDLKYLLLFLILLPILLHFHYLSAVILIIAGCAVIVVTILTRKKRYLLLSILLSLSGIGVYILVFVVQLSGTYFIKSAYSRMVQDSAPILQYYEYFFDNGLPVHSTMMVLIGSLGLLISQISLKRKIFYIVSIMSVLIAFILMTYTIYNEQGGRDYRYVAHFAPLTIGVSLFSLYYLSSKLYKSNAVGYAFLILPLIYSVLHFNTDKHRIYEQHTWHPQYSIAYKTIIDNYQPGESIMGFDISRVYLDGKSLAGESFKRIPKKNAYKLETLKTDMRKAGKGWITWPFTKMNNLNRNVLNHIYKNCLHYHGYNVDQTNIEVFYFNLDK